MSGKNKNYNSIIFLTTLSVYLGLSLLGATPQVLAYAATTRNFDIQTEVELKEDLDNKPEEEILSDASVKCEKAEARILRQYARYVSALLKINDPLRLSLDSEKALIDHSFSTSKEELVKSFAGLKIDKDSFLNRQPSPAQPENQSPSAFPSNYNSSFNLWRSQSNTASLDKDYINKNISAENNQVFIVTRLPRAGIDSLIK